TVNIGIVAMNDAPTANADSYQTNQNTVLTVPAPGVLANDTDIDGDSLTASLVSNTPAGTGTVVLQTNGAFTYTPAFNFVGNTSFTYQASDGRLSATAVVTISVAPVNTAPIANNDSFTTPANGTLSVPAPGVLANDTDAETPNTALRASLVSGAAHGTLALNSNGSFPHTPAAGVSGPQTLPYRANDGQLSSNVATVLINVTPPPSTGSPFDKFVTALYRDVLSPRDANGNITVVRQPDAPGFAFWTISLTRGTVSRQQVATF